jgi:hypothetical protein
MQFNYIYKLNKIFSYKKMILPPHILKYQKQLQELNKLSAISNNLSTKKSENDQSQTFTQKDKKGKNKSSNKFLNLNSTSKNNTISKNLTQTQKDTIINEFKKEEEYENINLPKETPEE